MDKYPLICYNNGENMQLTYQFELKVNNRLANILGHLTYASSKLFNVGNYERYEYKQLGFDKMPNWYDQKKRLKDNTWYKSLPAQSSQDILARLNESWKSYSVLHSRWLYKKEHGHLKEGEGEPHSPNYKKDGSHSNVKYLRNSFKVVNSKVRFMIPKALKAHLKDKYQIDDEFFYIKLKKSFELIKQIEFSYVDKNRYKVYIIYEKETPESKEDNKHYISIDIGTKNLLTIYDNNGSSFIIGGQSILNTNYYFSKKIAYYQSLFDKCYPNQKKGKATKRIKRLYELKRKRINLILHRASKRVIDYCLTHDISKIIVGDLSGLLNSKKEFANNKEKHRYNQNIRSVCFKKIYSHLSYKTAIKGIELIIVNESYSSSCSPYSRRVSQKYSHKYYRRHRGSFKDGGKIFNADSVGAFNIMRLYRQNNSLSFDMPIKGLSNPKREYIPVTDQFVNEDYINWNGKSGNVGISGRNYPTGNELINLINESMITMHGKVIIV